MLLKMAEHDCLKERPERPGRGGRQVPKEFFKGNVACKGMKDLFDSINIQEKYKTHKMLGTVSSVEKVNDGVSCLQVIKGQSRVHPRMSEGSWTSCEMMHV